MENHHFLVGQIRVNPLLIYFYGDVFQWENYKLWCFQSMLNYRVCQNWADHAMGLQLTYTVSGKGP